jgi:hypothetical protein
VFILEAQRKTSKCYISMVIGSNLFKSRSFKFYSFAKVLEMSKIFGIFISGNNSNLLKIVGLDFQKHTTKIKICEYSHIKSNTITYFPRRVFIGLFLLISTRQYLYLSLVVHFTSSSVYDIANVASRLSEVSPFLVIAKTSPFSISIFGCAKSRRVLALSAPYRICKGNKYQGA